MAHARVGKGDPSGSKITPDLEHWAKWGYDFKILF